MSTAALWPPLDEVRRVLGAPVEEAGAGAREAGAWEAVQDLPDLALAPALPEPLRVLAEARLALAVLQDDGPWQAGDIVALPGPGGNLLGILLDEAEPAEAGPGRRWRGWMTAAEADWAGVHDVLLEPDDGPFDPVAAVVQAWNPVRVLERSAPLLGRLGPARLAAVRAVCDEFASAAGVDNVIMAPRPGLIALRQAGGFTVLTGTPLASGDPRAPYQAMYREAARQLVQPAAAAVQPEAPIAVAATPWWRRLRSWLGVDGPTRVGMVAASLAALVLILHGLYPAAPIGMPIDDEVRFRSLEAPVAGAELSVRWREGADPEAIAALVRSFGGEVVDGPNAAGLWTLRSPDPAVAQRTLLASPLVLEVIGP